jgi:ribulose-phosphate 3-epimerase
LILAPSILSADLAALGAAAQACAEGGADRLHVDVMDGHFAPQLTFGLPVVKALAKVSRLPLDVHLMIANPDEAAPAYAEAGAFQVVVHWETARHLQRLCARLRQLGARAGVALNPTTSDTALEFALDWLDHVLVMTVNPGYSGQSFLEPMLRKVERLRSTIERRGLAVEIGADGGVSRANIGMLRAAGVTSVVAGSAVFDDHDPIRDLRALRAAALSETV